MRAIFVRPLRCLAAASTVALVAACASETNELNVSGPTTASSTIIDLPPGSVSDSATVLERRLQASGVVVTAIDRENGFMRARTNGTDFIDCGQITETVNGRTRSFPGNSSRLVLNDPDTGGTLIRTIEPATSAGIGITPGATNTVVLRQQHLVRLTVRSGETGATRIRETRDFTDRGFAAFSDGTVCRSSDAMNRALQG